MAATDIFQPHMTACKKTQRWILDNILAKLSSSRNVTSYKKGKNIINNSSCHYAQKIVLHLDIKDFFPSINAGMVNAVFSGAGYNQQVSALLTKLCILDSRLPQGAPSSPTLSNLVLKQADYQIVKFIRKHNICYTRYADDLNFSGDFKPGVVIKFVEQVLGESGFQLNQQKTRIMRPDNRQIVTGIVVNEHSLGAPRAIRQQLRQTAYYINKFGIISHMLSQKITNPNYLAVQLGQAHYVKYVETAHKGYAEKTSRRSSHVTQVSRKPDSKIDAVIDVLRNAHEHLKKIEDLPALIQEIEQLPLFCKKMQLELFNRNS